MKLRSILSVSVICAMLSSIAFAQTQNSVSLQKGAVVKLELIEALSSQTNKKGDIVHFRAVSDITVDDVVVVKAGAEALGVIAEAKAAKGWGKGGKLTISIETLEAVDGTKIPLAASMGEGKAWAATKTILGVGVFGLAFGGAFKGKATHIPKGTQIDVFVSEDATINPNGKTSSLQQDAKDQSNSEASSLVNCFKLCESATGDAFKTCMKSCDECKTVCKDMPGSDAVPCVEKCLAE